MKVTTARSTEMFRPVDVTFTLESQKELDAMGTLFNTCHTVDGLRQIIGDYDTFGHVYQVFQNLDADINLHDKFRGKE